MGKAFKSQIWNVSHNMKLLCIQFIISNSFENQVKLLAEDAVKMVIKVGLVL